MAISPQAMELLPEEGLFVRAGNLSVVTKFLRGYFAFASEVGDEPNPTRQAHSGYPRQFNSQFPARVVQGSGGRGTHRQVKGMPEWMAFTVDIYDLLGRELQEQMDAIAGAEDNCLAAFAQWLDDVHMDDQLQNRVEAVEMTEYTMGATDRYGRAFQDVRSSDYLWRLRAEVRVKL